MYEFKVGILSIQDISQADWEVIYSLFGFHKAIFCCYCRNKGKKRSRRSRSSSSSSRSRSRTRRRSGGRRDRSRF